MTAHAETTPYNPGTVAVQATLRAQSTDGGSVKLGILVRLLSLPAQSRPLLPSPYSSSLFSFGKTSL